MEDPTEGSTEATGKGAPDSRWAVLAHLAHFVVLVGIPGFLGPLLVWLLTRTEDAFAAGEAKEALNFHLSLLLYALALVALAIAALFDRVGLLLPVALGFALMLAGSLILPIVAAVRVSAGERYRYPLTIRFF